VHQYPFLVLHQLDCNYIEGSGVWLAELVEAEVAEGAVFPGTFNRDT